MKEIGSMLDEIENLMYKNCSLLELMRGYCFSKCDKDNYIQLLMPGVDLVLDNQKIISEKIDEISNYVYRKEFPDLFKSVD